jgi:hypothetical protein
MNATKKAVNLKTFRKLLRTAIANYMYSEGCGCCSNREQHEDDRVVLAKLLNVPKCSDNSGFDFYKFKECE